MRLLVFGGWFGSRNLGDDAILIGLKNVFGRTRPNLEIVALSTDPEYTRGVCGVEALPLKSPRELLAGGRHYADAFIGADACVVSGGTPIYDYDHASRSLHFLLPRLTGRKLVCFGIGVKRLLSCSGRHLVRGLLRGASRISVRDIPSLHELGRLGLKRRASVTGDSALFIEPSKPKTAKEKLASCGVDPGGRLATICPRVLSTSHRAHYHSPVSAGQVNGIHRKIALAADRLSEEGFDVIFLPMHRAPTDDDRVDVSAIRRMMEEPSRVLDTYLLPGEAAAVIGLSEVVIGLRLHSLVFAAIQGVPMASVDYDPKIRGFMKMAGAEEFLDPLGSSPYDLARLVSAALDGGSPLGRRLLRSCGRMRERIEAEAREVAVLLR